MAIVDWLQFAEELPSSFVILSDQSPLGVIDHSRFGKAEICPLERWNVECKFTLGAVSSMERVHLVTADYLDLLLA